MSLAAVADDIDDHIPLEALAIIIGQLRHAHARFRIVAVHMKNRRLHRKRHVGAIDAAAAFERIRREPNLVIRDNVNGAAGLIPIQLR